MPTWRAKFGRNWKVGIAFGALTIANVVGFYLIERQAEQNSTALAALCAQRDDLDQRIVVQTALLQSHPGNLVFGLPRKLILSGLHRDQTTRQNLEILDCKEAP